MSGRINDDSYLIRALSTGVPINVIASKLRMKESEVLARKEEIIRMVEDQTANGYLALCDFFHIFAHQYQLLGESMKIMGQALGNAATDAELKKLITTDPEETLRNIRLNCIVLRPYVAKDPQVEANKTVAGN